MDDDLPQLIRKTAAQVRFRDFLWSLAIATGIMGVIAFSIPALNWWLPAAGWLSFFISLAVRYRFASNRAWAAPVQRIIEGEMNAQQAELQSLRLARGVAQALPEPLFILDREGAIEHANPAAEEFVNATDVQNRHFTSVMRAPDVFEAVRSVAAGAPAHAVEFSSLGSVERHSRAFIAPLGDNDAPERILVYLRDLTSERRVEQMRVDFIASASHELRTPLASLLGFIETLRGHAKSDPAAQEKFLGIMQTQAERMQRLVSDLMSLSRIELQEHVRPDENVNLRIVAEEIVESLSPLIDTRGATVSIHHQATHEVVVAGDRDQIMQAAQNLIDNAIKYGGQEPTIDVHIGAGEAPAMEGDGVNRIGDSVDQLSARLMSDRSTLGYLQVRDQGKGIARGFLPRLTERFYRVNVEDSKRAGGTGLGLAIVKHILNRHQGGLSIESAEGVGASFTCYFPRAKIDASSVASEE